MNPDLADATFRRTISLGLARTESSSIVAARWARVAAISASIASGEVLFCSPMRVTPLSCEVSVR